jgi:DNA-binding response OmpR family regulator
MRSRILIVDDDEALQRVMKRAFEAAGFEVFQALDGPDALLLAAKERFALIVLDINMPTMDGRDVLARLKGSDNSSHVPILVHSSRSAQLDRHVALKLGAVDFIDKPIEAQLLAGRVRRLIAADSTRVETEPIQGDEVTKKYP